MTQMIKQVSND